MADNKYCIIMAGGVGSRFWPMSRGNMPKQFLDILGTGKSMLQMTIDRFSKIVPKENIFIVTAEKYRDIMPGQAEGIPSDNILYEPFKRNTAPCIAYATYKLLGKNPDATVVVTPSDHVIIGEDNFVETISAVMDYASSHDRLFTIGIKPTFPNTNYGYIQFNKEMKAEDSQKEGYQVKTFTEKPNLDLAKIFVESGEFLWNSGMFIWNLKTIKEELEHYLPEITELFSEQGEKVYFTDRENDFILHSYENSPSISIDYGVMEKTRKAWVFPADFGWSDIGTWESLYEYIGLKDSSGNAVTAPQNIIDDDEGSMILEKNKEKLVVVKGLKDFMVIDTDDVLMVCPRDDAAIKEILVELTAQDKGKYL